MTSRYPTRPDEYAEQFPGAIALRLAGGVEPSAAEVCPTGAIAAQGERITLDRGRCVLCGLCVAARPDAFAVERGSATARTHRETLVVPVDLATDEASLAQVRAGLDRRVRALRRSVHIRHVDVGSDGSEEWEIQALTNPTYDVHRLGIFFTASPRHADILLVTGAGARGMLDPLRRTHEGMPNPVVVIAVGTDAISGGLVSPSYATTGGLSEHVDIDVYVPGSPPPPFAILHGILLALGRVSDRRSTAQVAP